MAVLGDQSTSTRHRRPTIPGDQENAMSKTTPRPSRAQQTREATINYVRKEVEALLALQVEPTQRSQIKNAVYRLAGEGAVTRLPGRRCNVTKAHARYTFQFNPNPVRPAPRPSRAQQTREATLNDVRKEVEALLHMGCIDQKCAAAVLEQLNLIRKKSN